jgi:SagB-type dehydrogenase family enzyme
MSLATKVLLGTLGLAKPRRVDDPGAPRVELPAAATEGGMSLAQALAHRHSTREFSARPLPLEVLSGLLWAACGTNRSDGGRTVPSPLDLRPVEVYAALANGVYRYDGAHHTLVQVAALDVRPQTGLQSFVDEAPLDVVLVADRARERMLAERDREPYAFSEAGAIAQNLYLWCAAQGLGCVVRAMIDREALAHAMGLRADERVLLALTIGYPAHH